MSQQKRRGPARAGQPSPNTTTNSFDSSVLPGYQRHEPLDAEDRADAKVIAAAFERGYRIAVQCIHCGHWVSNPKSVRLHAGPRCRTKAAQS